MSNPYPIPRTARQTDILLGNGGTTYGPFDGFKIFDVEDVVVYTRPAGESAFAVTSATVSKVSGSPFDHFTIKFSSSIPDTTEYIVRSERVPERDAGVVSGTRVDPTALEKELSKIAAFGQELRRDVDRAVVMGVGAGAPLIIAPGLVEGDTLVIGPDGSLVKGERPNVFDKLNAKYKVAPSAPDIDVLSRLKEEMPLSGFGAVAGGGVFGPEISAAAEAAVALNLPLVIPPGVWTISAPIILDYSAFDQFNPGHLRSFIVGAGSGNTFLVSTFNGPLIQYKGGSSGNGHEWHGRIEGVTLIGPGVATASEGISIDHAAWLDLKDVYVTNFGLGFWARDLEYLRATGAILRFNGRGGIVTTRDPADAVSSNPNAHLWEACTVSSNTLGGLVYDRPNCLKIIGGDFQYNGLTSPTQDTVYSHMVDGVLQSTGVKIPGRLGALAVRNGGVQGGRVVSLDTIYFEHNYGLADVHLIQDDAAFGGVNAAIYEINSDFKRALPPPNKTVDTHIAINFINNCQQQVVIVRGNSFKDFNGAVSTEPFLKFIGEKKRKNISLSVGDNVLLNQADYRQDTADGIPFAIELATTVPGSGAIEALGTVIRRFKGEFCEVNGFIVVNSYADNAGDLLIKLPKKVALGHIAVGAAVNATDGYVLFANAEGGATQLLVKDPSTEAHPPAGKQVNFSVTYECDD